MDLRLADPLEIAIQRRRGDPGGPLFPPGDRRDGEGVRLEAILRRVPMPEDEGRVVEIVGAGQPACVEQGLRLRAMVRVGGRDACQSIAVAPCRAA